MTVCSGLSPWFNLVMRLGIWELAARFAEPVPSLASSRKHPRRQQPSRRLTVRSLPDYMLFSQKTKGFFVELNDQGVMLARTSSATLPFTIEDMRECPAKDPAALEEALKQIQPKKGPSGYLHAAVGIYPAKRLVRRHSLE